MDTIRNMSTRASKGLIVAGSGMGALFLGALLWLAVHSEDLPAPDVSDLVPDTVRVPDQENAYPYLREALASLQWPRNQPGLEATADEWDDAVVTDLLAHNGETLAKVEQALACPAYHPYADEPGGSAPWPRLLLLIAQKAAYEARAGRSEVACETSCGLLRLACWLTSQPRSLPEWSAGRTALDLGLAGVERWLHEARPREAELAAVLARLSQVDALDRGLVHAFKREFQRLDGAIDECIVRRPRPALLTGDAFQPNRTRTTAAQFYRQVIQNVSRPYTQRQLPEVPPLLMSGVHRLLLSVHPNKQGRMLEALFLPDRGHLDGCFVSKCRTQSDLDALRLVLACRLYEMRQGRLPQTLEALVPDLLPKVPPDPFDGAPFRYVPADAVVYSVGEDLKDSWTSAAHPSSPPTIQPAAESAEPSGWPEYLTPRRSLIRTGYEAGDLVYHIHARPE